jgi:molybdenum cofactor synthesis domain-containing protein
MSDPRPDQVAQEHRSTGRKTAGCFVLTVSDSKTATDDTSGNLIRELLTAAGHTVVGHAIVRDEPTQVVAVIREGLAKPDHQVFILTGGTGITSRDSTFEAVESMLAKRITGFGELFRALLPGWARRPCSRARRPAWSRDGSCSPCPARRMPAASRSRS